MNSLTSGRFSLCWCGVVFVLFVGCGEAGPDDGQSSASDGKTSSDTSVISVDAGDNNTPCSTVEDCDQDDPCSTAACGASGFCTYAPLPGEVCDDGNCCTAIDICSLCSSGDCSASGLECRGLMQDCDDDETCTEDICTCAEGATEGACAHDKLPDGSECSYSENDCTTGDQCKAGQCAPGPVMDLDDKNPCTLDTCEKGQVEHKALAGGQCDDGNECTLDDFCYQMTCTGGPLIECLKPGCASSISCIPGEGCVPVWMPEGSPCDDNFSCTENDVCDADHGCVGTSDVLCNDWNPCTADICDTLTDACRHLPVENLCDDDDPCTDSDLCMNGQCVGTPKDCSFMDTECTHHECVPDSNSADGYDCVALSPPCNDGNLCTKGTCDMTNYTCSYEPVSGACDDGDSCTKEDACDNGACVGATMDCSALDTDCLEGFCQAGICETKIFPGCLVGETCEVPFDLGKAGGTVVANLCDYVQNYDHEWCETKESSYKEMPGWKGPELIIKFKANYKQGKLTVDKGASFDQMVWNYRTVGACGSEHAGYCYGPGNNQGPAWGGYSPNSDRYIAIGSADGSCGDIDFTVHAECNAGCSSEQICTPQGKCCEPGTICTPDGECCDDDNPCTDDSCKGGECAYSDNNLPCDDGNLCTLKDLCSAGACHPGTAKVCEDDQQCVDGECVAQ